jgi:hypothetical protein
LLEEEGKRRGSEGGEEQGRRQLPATWRGGRWRHGLDEEELGPAVCLRASDVHIWFCCYVRKKRRRIERKEKKKREGKKRKWEKFSNLKISNEKIKDNYGVGLKIIFVKQRNTPN